MNISSPVQKQVTFFAFSRLSLDPKAKMDRMNDKFVTLSWTTRVNENLHLPRAQQNFHYPFIAAPLKSRMILAYLVKWDSLTPLGTFLTTTHG